MLDMIGILNMVNKVNLICMFMLDIVDTEGIIKGWNAQMLKMEWLT